MPSDQFSYELPWSDFPPYPLLSEVPCLNRPVFRHKIFCFLLTFSPNQSFELQGISPIR